MDTDLDREIRTEPKLRCALITLALDDVEGRSLFLSWDVDAWRKWIAATRLNPQPSELQAAVSLKLFETIGNASPADLARIVKGMFLSRNDDPYFCAVTLAFLAAIETMKKVLSGAPPAMTLDDAARRLIDE